MQLEQPSWSFHCLSLGISPKKAFLMRKKMKFTAFFRPAKKKKKRKKNIVKSKTVIAGGNDVCYALWCKTFRQVRITRTRRILDEPAKTIY